MSDDMEARLMARINDGFERVNDRLGAVEQRLGAVENRLGSLDQQAAGMLEMHRNTNLLLNTMIGMLTDFGRRITDLEKK